MEVRMSRLPRFAVAISAALIMAAAPAPSSAQDIDTLPVPIVEVSAGYVLMKDTSAEHKYPAGWYVSAATNLTRWFGVVGEASGSYRSSDATFLSGTLTLSEKAQVYTFMGGPRFFRKVGRIVPFGQALVGIATERLQQTETRTEGYAAGVNTWSPSSTNLAVQPGGGLAVYLTEAVGLRVSGDYRIIVDTDDDDVRNGFRFLTGFALQWGRR
jgi:hypothetical protein